MLLISQISQKIVAKYNKFRAIATSVIETVNELTTKYVEDADFYEMD